MGRRVAKPFKVLLVMIISFSGFEAASQLAAPAQTEGETAR